MTHDRIVLGCPDQRLQERLLREPDLTLDKALTIRRAAEAMKEQLRAIAGNVSVHQVDSARGTYLSSRKSCSRVRGTSQPEVGRHAPEVQSLCRKVVIVARPGLALQSTSRSVGRA